MWKDLDIRQKTELMRGFVRNGVTDRDEMVRRYNSFAMGGPEEIDGGNLLDGNTHGSQQMDNDRSGISRFARKVADRVGKAARVKAMDIAYGIGGKGVRHINDGVRRSMWREVYPDVLQETYLFPSEEADRLIQKNGYTRLSENSDNYGLVEEKAREYLDKGIDLPYYEWHSNNNGVSRDDLESVGHNWILPGYYINTRKNYRKGWYGDPSEQLPHGGNHKSTIYYNESDGEFYQRAWDLNDYGGDGSGASGRYLKPLRKAASKLDEKGNPAVVRTPLSRVQDDRFIDMLNDNPEVLETVNGLGFIYPSVVTANARAHGGPVDGVIDWSGIATTGNRGYNADYLDYEYNKLRESGKLTDNQIAATLGTWIEKSGGDPYKVSSDGMFSGLNQWGADRYSLKSVKNPSREQVYAEIDRQIAAYLNSINNLTDRKSWTHGGTGSGYNRASDAYRVWNDPQSSLEDMFRAHSWGYTRPTGKEASYNNGLKVVRQVLDRMNANSRKKGGYVNILGPGGGSRILTGEE